MDWFSKIKGFYDRKLWPINWVADAVRANRITEEQFEEITGQDYLDYSAS